MAKKWKNMILGWPPVQAVISFLKRVKVPGLAGLTAWEIGKFLAEGVMKGSIETRAAAISFRLFLAFFPVIILLLSLIPIIPIENFQQNLFDSIRGFFPGDTFQLFESTLVDLLTKKQTALLSIGFILMIYYASSSIHAILVGFNESYLLEEKGNAIVMRVASIILIFVLGVFMVVAVSLIMFSGITFTYLHNKGLLPDAGIIPILNFVKWVISIFLMYTVVSTLYNVGNGKRRMRWKFFNAGATFATVFFVLNSIILSWFVANFASYNRLYGSLGTLLVLLIWLNFNCVILLLGFELNTSILRARKHNRKPKEIIRNTIKNDTTNT